MKKNLKRILFFSAGLVATHTSVYAASDIDNTCNALGKLVHNSAPFTYTEGKSCSLSYDQAQEIGDRTSLKKLLTAAKMDESTKLSELLPLLDEDGDNTNGVIINVQSIDNFLTDHLKNNSLANTLLAGRVFYTEAYGELYQITFDQGLSQMTATRMDVVDNDTVATNDITTIDNISIIRDNMIKMNASAYTVKEFKNGVRVSNKEETLKLYSNKVKGIKFLKRHKKKNIETEFSFLNVSESFDFLNDDLLEQEQSNAADTETGQIQNYDKRMDRMVQEYHLVMNLVDNITHESVDSGAWSDPRVWKDGKVPGDGARVLINKEHRVIVNSELTTHIRTIKLAGELAFNPHKNTQLILDTMVTLPGSVLRIGEPRLPIDENKKAQIIISDYNNEGMITDDPDSKDYDPLRIGQGILTNGLFLAHGSDKTPYVAIAGDGVAKGATEIPLDEEVEGWQVGDEVVVNGISDNGTESEIRKIVAIDSDKVVLDKALEYDHIVPETTIDDLELKVHIANITRNIIIKTDPKVLEGQGDKNDPSNVEHRGHVLFMHNNNVNINDVEFKDLGRTNKKYPLHETKFESEDIDAKVVEIGTNQAARYPVHFHRAGLDGKVGRVNDCVVYNSPGWGYVNHSSNVIMKENIAYGVYGASFITEAGDENGVFEANMAIATRGLGEGDVKSWKSRESYDDWGFQGNAFWLLGVNVDIVDNIAVGSSNTAFAVAHKTIDDVTGVVDSTTQNEKSVTKVALKSFVGNIAYGNSGGVFGILSGTRNKTTEVIDGLVAYSNRGMGTDQEIISWWYPDNVVLNDITIVGDIYNPRYTGIGTQTKLRKTTIRNVKIEGLEVGLRVPEYIGLNIVENAYLNNLVNMYYKAGTTNKGANTKITGDIVYGTLPNNPKQVKMKFSLDVRDVNFKNYWNRQFNKFNIVYAPNGEDAKQLYLTREQKPDFVIEVGDQKGKTNLQLVNEGRRPVGGVLLPSNAVEMEDMENVSGTTIE